MKWRASSNWNIPFNYAEVIIINKPKGKHLKTLPEVSDCAVEFIVELCVVDVCGVDELFAEPRVGVDERVVLVIIDGVP